MTDETPGTDENLITGTPIDSEMTLVKLSPDNLIAELLGADDEQFRDAIKDDLFSFSVALVAMKRGLHVARASWQQPGKYVFLQPAEEFIFDPSTGAPVPIKEHLCWKNGEGR